MPGVNLGITLPTVGVTVGPDYATQINAALNTIIADIEAKIIPGEVTTNSDWDFSSGGTSYSLTNAKRLGLTNQSAVLSGGNLHSVYSKDGELHFQDGAGNNVQLTSGGSVNNAGAGSINTTGSPAYGSGPEVLWDGGNSEYNFKSEAGATDYANLVFAALEFRNGANTMTMSSGVTSDYALAFPATGPANANDMLQVDASGNISFTNAISVASVATSGAVTAGGDVTGTDCLFTDTRTMAISAAAGIGSSTTSFQSASGSNKSYWNAPSGGTTVVEFAVPVPQGSLIEEIFIWFRSTSTSSNFTVRLMSHNEGGITEIDSDTFNPGSTNTDLLQTFDNSDHTVVTDEAYIIRIEMNTTGNKRIYGVAVRYSRPA